MRAEGMALGCVRVDLTVRLRRGVEAFLTRLLVYFVPHFLVHSWVCSLDRLALSHDYRLDSTRQASIAASELSFDVRQMLH